MTDTQSSYPSFKEMEARILRNLSRLQGYLDILQSEIADPEKMGTGTSREDWKAAADELDRNVKAFKALLELRHTEPAE